MTGFSLYESLSARFRIASRAPIGISRNPLEPLASAPDEPDCRAGLSLRAVVRLRAGVDLIGLLPHFARRSDAATFDTVGSADLSALQAGKMIEHPPVALGD